MNVNDVRKYPKINGLYKRDSKGNFTSEFSRPEFEYLYDNQWIGTEKIHGTNIRLAFFDGEYGAGERGIFGRGNNSDIPHFLLARLSEIVDSLDFESVFPAKDVVLYGEGYGKGIQDVGSRYLSSGTDFILFDVLVNSSHWLSRDNVEYVAKELGVSVVPTQFVGSLREAEEYVRQGYSSSVAEDKSLAAEGLVLVPPVPIYDNRRNRIITKLKTRDYSGL